MKNLQKIIGGFLLLSALTVSAVPTFAASKDEAIEAYTEYENSRGGADPVSVQGTAIVTSLINGMKASQEEMTATIETLKKRVENLQRNDERKEDAEEKVGVAEGAAGTFTALGAENELTVIEGVGGTAPVVIPSDTFTAAESEAIRAIGEVNKLLIAPGKPATVPGGRLIEDFIPQIIRQLFRFAWLGVLVSFVISGVYLVIASGNDERVTKAKDMIYYTLIGFAFVIFSFAIVKAVTDIDFFRFI